MRKPSRQAELLGRLSRNANQVQRAVRTLRNMFSVTGNTAVYDVSNDVYGRVQVTLTVPQFEKMLSTLQDPNMWVFNDAAIHSAEFPTHLRMSLKPDAKFDDVEMWIRSNFDRKFQFENRQDRRPQGKSSDLAKIMWETWIGALPQRLQDYYNERFDWDGVVAYVRFERSDMSPSVPFFHWDNMVPSAKHDPNMGLSLAMSFCSDNEPCSTLFKPGLIYVDVRKLESHMNLPRGTLDDINHALDGKYALDPSVASKYTDQWTVCNLPSHALHASPPIRAARRVFVIAHAKNKDNFPIGPL